MGIVVTENPFGLEGENDFEIVTDQYGDDVQKIRIHPWDRSEWPGGFGKLDRSVFLSIGWYGPSGEGLKSESGDDATYMQNTIVNRDDFVEGILAVFPELKRA